MTDRKLSKDEIRRYSRHLKLDSFSLEKQERLKNSQVAIIGMGGLGVPNARILCSSGVGKIRLIDGDKIQESNLPRQNLYTSEDLGEYKTLTAKKHLKSLNPECQLEAITEYLTPTNAMEVLKDVDLVIDGSDTIACRYLIQDSCEIMNLPWIYCSLFLDEFQLAIFNDNGSCNYRCLFPQPPGEDALPSCSETGILSTVSNLAGSTQAHQALLFLLESDDYLKNKLLIFNTRTFSQQKLNFGQRKREAVSSLLANYDAFCGVNSFSPLAFEKEAKDIPDLQEGQYKIIDLREDWEKRIFPLPALNLEENELHAVQDANESLFVELMADKRPIIIVCYRGMKSAALQNHLASLTEDNKIVSLFGGIRAWLTYYQKYDLLY